MIIYEPTIRCGHCGGRHRYVIEVEACYGMLPEGEWPCSWLIQGLLPTGDPDEPYYQGTFECGAPCRMRADGTGYDCAAGHSHTYAQVLAERGQAYAEDDLEAAYLAKYGTEPLDLVTGAPWARPLPSV